MSNPDKASLRDSLVATRKARSRAEVDDARSAIRDHVLHRLEIERWECVAAYEPLPTEPGSTRLLTAMHERGVRVLVPITLSDRDLDWTVWTPARRAEPLAVGGAPDLGRDAIEAADAVLVPALAVAPDGARLGRGGGSYDRALGRRSPRCVAAALVFTSEVVGVVPRDPWDVAVDAVVTPAGWRTLRGNAADADGR